MSPFAHAAITDMAWRRASSGFGSRWESTVLPIWNRETHIQIPTASERYTQLYPDPLRSNYFCDANIRPHSSRAKLLAGIFQVSYKEHVLRLYVCP